MEKTVIDQVLEGLQESTQELIKQKGRLKTVYEKGNVSERYFDVEMATLNAKIDSNNSTLDMILALEEQK